MSSSYAEATNAAMEHLETMSNLHPDLSSEYESFSNLFSRKLWHQLTSALLSFVSDERRSVTLRATADGGNSYLALYDKVVLSCDAKLNQLSLARIASAVAASLISTGEEEGGGGGESSKIRRNPPEDALAARAILENLLEKRARLGPSATLYVESKLVLIQLRQPPRNDEEANQSPLERYESVKVVLKDGAKVLAEMEGESAVVHSSFYEASTAYRKMVGPPEEFYREALMYLNYTPVESMTEEERFTLATDLSLAALTGDGVFNFGEVVATPILSFLHNTPNAWLMELMHCFARGDVDQFFKVTEASSDAIGAQPALVSRASLVKEKITLLAVVNMVFERPSHERTLTFDEIAERTKIEKDGVEVVIMRALSLGLIKGSMDQVDETVSVTWVMPRVLNEMQLKTLSERFGEWAVKVSKTRDYMVEHTAGLVA